VQLRIKSNPWPGERHITGISGSSSTGIRESRCIANYAPHCGSPSLGESFAEAHGCHPQECSQPCLKCLEIRFWPRTMNCSRRGCWIRDEGLAPAWVIQRVDPRTSSSTPGHRANSLWALPFQGDAWSGRKYCLHRSIRCSARAFAIPTGMGSISTILARKPSGSPRSIPKRI
jgi:hypothetical protein